MIMPNFLLLLLVCTLTAADAGSLLFKQTDEDDNSHKVPSIEVASSVVGGSITCPDNTICHGMAACCRTFTNTYRCCYSPNNVCCDDGNMCCPRLTVCDYKGGKCLPGARSPPWSKPIPSVPAASTPIPADYEDKQEDIEKIPPAKNGIVCRNGIICPDMASCCKNMNGGYMCCGYPSNVCCANGIYCCMRGTICDARTFQCIPGDGNGAHRLLPWDTPRPAVPGV